MPKHQANKSVNPSADKAARRATVRQILTAVARRSHLVETHALARALARSVGAVA